MQIMIWEVHHPKLLSLSHDGTKQAKEAVR